MLIVNYILKKRNEIKKIPSDIFIHVYEFLDNEKDQANLSLVNKQFRDLYSYVKLPYLPIYNYMVMNVNKQNDRCMEYLIENLHRIGNCQQPTAEYLIPIFIHKENYLRMAINHIPNINKSIWKQILYYIIINKKYEYEPLVSIFCEHSKLFTKYDIEEMQAKIGKEEMDNYIMLNNNFFIK